VERVEALASGSEEEWVPFDLTRHVEIYRREDYD
jgi:hypothetical protein